MYLYYCVALRHDILESPAFEKEPSGFEMLCVCLKQTLMCFDFKQRQLKSAKKKKWKS